MATITGLTADRMQQIIDKTIVSANIVGGHLILTLSDGSTVDAGVATGPQGPSGIQKVTAFPTVPAPTDGDMVVRTDMAGDPVYKYTTANGWVLLAGGLAKVTAFPATPVDGDGVVRTDLNGSPIFMYSTENGWEQLPRMGAVTVPSSRVRRTTNQSIPVTTPTVISFDTEEFDTDTIHDVVTNTSRLTIKTPGLYKIDANIHVPPAGGGTFRQFFITQTFAAGGTARIGQVTEAVAGVDTHLVVSGLAKFAAGDYVELTMYHDGSGAISLPGDTNFPTFSATWLGGAGQTVDERGVPAANLRASTAQSIPNTTFASVAFDTELFDTDGSHDTAVNNTRFLAKTAGLYSFQGRVNWGTNNVGRRFMQLIKNGSSVIADVERTANAGATGATVSQEISANAMLAAGDYVELQVYQSIGSAYSLTQNDHTPALDVVFVGSGKTVTPYAKVYPTVAQSITGDGATNILTFDAEEADNDGIHDQVSNKTRLTCRTAGVYHIHGNLLLATGGGTLRHLYINKNGSTIEYFQVPAASPRIGIDTLVELAVGDYVEFGVAQDSGSALATSTGAAGTKFAMVKIGAPIAGQTGIEIVEGWHLVGAAGEPAFQNASTAVAANPPKFYKDPKGVVRLTGIANSPGANTTIFQLPVGYRPLTDQYKIGCQPNNQAAIMTWVGSDGTVKTMSASGNQIDLSVHTFRADQ